MGVLKSEGSGGYWLNQSLTVSYTVFRSELTLMRHYVYILYAFSCDAVIITQRYVNISAAKSDNGMEIKAFMPVYFRHSLRFTEQCYTCSKLFDKNTV